MYALKQWLEVHLQFIIIEDVDYSVFCQSFLSYRSAGLLTLVLFICNEFNCTTNAAHPEQGVPLPPRSPKSCSVFHVLNGKLADLCTHSPYLKQPLFHGCCHSVLDLYSQRRQRWWEMLEKGSLGNWGRRHTLYVFQWLLMKKHALLKVSHDDSLFRRRTLSALQYLPSFTISLTRFTTSNTRRQACRVSIASSRLVAVFLVCRRLRFLSTKPLPSCVTLVSKEAIVSFILSV